MGLLSIFTIEGVRLGFPGGVIMGWDCGPDVCCGSHVIEHEGNQKLMPDREILIFMLQWMDIFGAFLAEAYCFKGGHVPSLEEYLTNAVTTGGTYMALVHAFFLMGQGVTRENMAMLKPYPNIFSCSGKILRLWDDLGTARVGH